MNFQSTFQQLEQPSQTFLSCYAYIGSAGNNYTSHCHSYYEISFIFKGTRYETLNRDKYKVGDNSLIFISPLSVHSLANITEVENLVIQFDHLFIRNSSMLFGNNYVLKPSENQQSMTIHASDCLYHTLVTIRDCCKKRDALINDDESSLQDRLAIDMKISSLCLDVIFYLLDEGKIYVDLKCVAYSNILSINSLISEVIAHPEKTINMQEASRIASMSYSHFGRFFEKITGFKYKYFCNYFRVRHAEELLLTTDKSVSEIAEAIGINTVPYFTRLFKQINGNTPRDYRRKYRA